MGKRVTIADLAKASGYSKTAVSFAFNAPERISQAAREKILKVADRLNYIPDPRARNFSLGRQFTLGFLLPQDIETCLLNPYIVDVTRGLGRVCQEHGYMLSLVPPLNDSVYEAVKGATVDGLVTMGYLLSDGVGSLADQINLPLVMIDGGEDETFLSVNIDDENAAYTQLESALKLGHRKISIVSLPAPSLQSAEGARGIVARRLAGYRRALADYGIRDEDVNFFSASATTYAEGQLTAASIVARGSTCVVTMSDIQAYGIISWMECHDIRVPEDISVIGFDNIDSFCFRRRLSTISQPGFEKGRTAARLMFDLLEGRKVEKAPLVPFSVIEGETLGPAPQEQRSNYGNN